MDITKVEQIKSMKDIAHVLHRPDIYVGGVQKITRNAFLVTDDGSLTEKSITYSPALLKIIDEIINNAMDQKVRIEMSTGVSPEDYVKTIQISLTPEGVIKVANSGRGIPIVLDEETGKYAPELAFTTLKSSSNFDDSLKRYTGGRNGYGAALMTYFADWLEVATVYQDKIYKQRFSSHGTQIGTPEITTNSGGGHPLTPGSGGPKKPSCTIITFLPDYQILDKSSPDDIRELLRTRASEMSTIFNPGSLRVTFNDSPVPLKTFNQFLEKLTGTPEESFEKSGIFLYLSGPLEGNPELSMTTWRFAVWLTKKDRAFQISYVNGINTYEGGKHVSGLLRLLVKRLGKYLPKGITVGPKCTFSTEFVMKKINLYLICFIPNPEFTGQTKANMNTDPVFPEIPEEFVEAFAKGSGILELLKEEAKSKNKVQGEEGKKKLDAWIPKYSPANFAGDKPEKCTLIIVEGDSAGTGIVNGRLFLGRDGTDYYGIFTLKGKLLNPKRSPEDKVALDSVLTHLKKVLGLDTRVTYTSVKDLRYGSIMIATDQDYDGFHISGLIINFIHTYWPELLKIPGFVKIFRTAYIKFVGKGLKKSFYSVDHYNSWKDGEGKDLSGDLKFYKGLGKNDEWEFQEYFENLDKNLLLIPYVHDPSSGPEIERTNIMFETVFGKDTENRKKWLLESGGKITDEIDYSGNRLASLEYLDMFVKMFSKYNIYRNIPSIIDGLKPGQRKVITMALKMGKKKKEIKVLDLVGAVTGDMDYHHGNQALEDTITNMAQNFVGTNLVNLLRPKGSFGARPNPNPSAGRYLDTGPTKMAKALFGSIEPALLDYNYNEGMRLEPKNYYLPVPLVLFNGTSGIGSGWSTKIHKYDPVGIHSYLMGRLRDGKKADEVAEPKLYFHKFEGKIINDQEGEKSSSFFMEGKWTLDGNLLVITELPVWISLNSYESYLNLLFHLKVLHRRPKHYGYPMVRYTEFRYELVLSDDYLKKCENRRELALLKESKSASDDTNYEYKSKSVKEKEKAKGMPTLQYDIVKDFKLRIKCSTRNMYLFDDTNHWKHYPTVRDILEDFIRITGAYYDRLYNFRVSEVEKDITLTISKMIFILGVARDRKIKILERSYEEIVEDIVSYSDKIVQSEGSYDYLISMPMKVLTLMKATQLDEKLKQLQEDLEALKKISGVHLWLDDIKTFFKAFKEQLEDEKKKIN